MAAPWGGKCFRSVSKLISHAQYSMVTGELRASIISRMRQSLCLLSSGALYLPTLSYQKVSSAFAFIPLLCFPLHPSDPPFGSFEPFQLQWLLKATYQYSVTDSKQRHLQSARLS